MNANLG